MKTNFFKSIAKTRLIASLLGGGLLLALAFAACQDEKEFLGNDITPGEVVTLSLSPVLPANAGMKPLSSGAGGAGELDENSYDLRYILEVYDGSTLVGDRQVKTVDDYQAAAGVTFDISLPAKQYQLVFWADFVTEDTDTDLTYKTDDGLTAIEWKASDYTIGNNLRDAYYATQTIDLTAPANESITLHRPFGKLRILANDVEAYLDSNDGVTLGDAKLTYSAPTTFPKGFNALTGEPATETISLAAATCTPEYVTSVSVGGQSFTDVYLLAFDYFFVPSDLSTVSFDIELLDNQNATLASKTVTNAPVGVNKLTTVLGAMFAKYTADLSVTIADNFSDEKLTIDEALIWPELKAEKLAEALVSATANGTTVTLTGDVSAANVAVPAGVTLVVPADKTLTVTTALTNDGTLNVAGVAEVTGFTGTGTLDLQSGSKSKGLVATPANAATGWVWTFGNKQWSDRIKLTSTCDKNDFARGEDKIADCCSQELTGVKYYYYNFEYVNANKATLCDNGWTVPTRTEAESLISNTSSYEVVRSAWAPASGYMDEYSTYKPETDDDGNPPIRLWTQTDNTGVQDNGGWDVGTAYHYYNYYLSWSQTHVVESFTRTRGLEVRCVISD
jgi:hypothetical protein